MPTYEYQCKACGHQLEAFQKMSDTPLTECPTCHQETLQKLVSAAGFQLKGSGWYVTDYSNKNKPSAESKEANTDKKTDTTSAKETGTTTTDTGSTNKKATGST